jgi:hypothetical protein
VPIIVNFGVLMDKKDGRVDMRSCREKRKQGYLDMKGWHSCFDA